MIKDYAGFTTSLEDEELLDFLVKEANSCFRLCDAYLDKGNELKKWIDHIKMEMSLK